MKNRKESEVKMRKEYLKNVIFESSKIQLGACLACLLSL